MKKITVLFIGLISVVLFGFSTKAGRFGDGIRRPSDSARTAVAREWKGQVAPARADEYHRYLFGGVAKLRSVPGSLGGPGRGFLLHLGNSRHCFGTLEFFEHCLDCSV